ncbi:MAG: hypothetical protein MJA27_21655 [Pseudanabaenales cyanobacterium]|nr:hypothetical protein [Pseudanabaenales cyanobacterium]
MKVNNPPTPQKHKATLEDQLLSTHEAWRYLAVHFEKEVHTLDDNSLRILDQRLERLHSTLKDEQILRLQQLMQVI